MPIREISNVLIFKDGYYYLTIENYKFEQKGMFADEVEAVPTGSYRIAPDSLTAYNGFEFASDAYSYLASLHKPGVLNETI